LHETPRADIPNAATGSITFASGKTATSPSSASSAASTSAC
jgi:hypothetical protein